jgi:hypothetical protein
LLLLLVELLYPTLVEELAVLLLLVELLYPTLVEELAVLLVEDAFNLLEWRLTGTVSVIAALVLLEVDVGLFFFLDLDRLS